MDSRQYLPVLAGLSAGVLGGVLVAFVLMRGEPEPGRRGTEAGPVVVRLQPPAAPRVPPPPPAAKEPEPHKYVPSPDPPEPEKFTPAPPPSDYLAKFVYCPGFPDPGEPGYLRNSSFEGWEKRGAPLSWYANEFRQLGYRIEDKDVHDGERCIRVIDRSEEYQGKMWQLVRGGEALGGRRVRFSVWVKLLHGRKVVDYLSIFTPETDHFFGDDIRITQNEWQQVSIEREFPEKVSKVVVYVCCFSPEDKGEMLVDAARFEVVGD